MLPQFLPDRFITLKGPESSVELEQLFTGCAPADKVLPQRPGEDPETYAYRCKSLLKRFPLKRAVNQVLSGLATQQLSLEPDQPVLDDWDLQAIAQTLGRVFLTHGQAWLLPLVSPNGHPNPLVISPANVLATGEGLLVWREEHLGELNPDTLEAQNYLRVHVVRSGEYGVYRCDLPTLYSVTKGTPNKKLALEFEPQQVPEPKLFELSGSVGADAVDTIVAYLRVKSAILDVIATAGYVQRVVTPESQGNLDLPIDIDEYDTSARHLMKAQNFQFAEMSGTSLTSMLAILDSLAEEQLAELGLDLTQSATASGASREIDAGRLKALTDSVGRLVQQATGWLAQNYLRYLGLNPTVLAVGVDDYAVSGRSGVLATAQQTAAFYAQVPYTLPPEVWSELVRTVSGQAITLEPEAQPPQELGGANG